MVSDDVKITEPTDDQLRDIARKATGTGYYSGGVRALRAVWDAACRVPVAERMPEDVQALVDEAHRIGAQFEGLIGHYAEHRSLIRALAAALEAAYSQKGADR